jgi:superfamily II DNA helicase RecQ
MLQEDLMLTPEHEMPNIPWSKLRDDPVNKQAGWNFTRDERNRFPVEGEWWLFDRIGRDRKLQRRFMRSGPSFAWDKSEVEMYMAQVARFRENLLVLMHITGGQPARGPEILSIRHSNTVKGERRNIFIEDQLVVFVTRYHKGYSISGDVKIIHRYLPRAVGALWVWYMWLVLPWQQKLEVDVWKKKDISSHMWPADPDGTKWTSERMRKAIKRESVAGMGVELGIQSYRDLAIAISRRYLRKREAFRPDEDDEDGDRDEDAEHEIAAEQTGHTSHVEGMIYARGIMERDGEVASKRQRFRECSVMWHRFLGFPATPPDAVVAGEKRKRAPFEEEYEEARIDRCKRLRATNIHDALKQVMGEQAEFRGVQEVAMRAIMAGESPVVAVMGTGGGKSLLFMLPAFCSGGGGSVVVVPLIALRQDMQRRCQAMGIECAEWEWRRPPDAARVILVTPESAISEAFRTFLNRMRRTQRLDRIVIDECHVVLNDQMNFRKQMQQLGELCNVGVQMICLTATLPPSKEAELWRRIDFRAEEVWLFRAVTRRRNVRYAVKEIEGEGEAEKQEQVVALIQQKMRKYADGKTVVYCSSVEKVKALAEVLDCDGYYHAAAEKDGKLRAFMTGRKKVIVATSALGMGVDIPDIRVIWHVDPPRTLLDYAQESGRAGRDGLKSEAILVTGWGEGGYGEKREGVELVQRLIGSGRECGRAVLGEYLDGGERQECQEGEERCDQCDRSAEEEVGELEEVEGLGEGGELEEVEGLEEVGGLEEGRGLEEVGGLEEMEGLEKMSVLEEGADVGETGITGGESGECETVAVMGEEQMGRQPPRAEGDPERRVIRMQQQRQEMVARRGAERMQQEGLELEELEQQLQRARGKCASCVEFGIKPDNHSLFWCREESSEQFRRDYTEIKEAIRRGRTMEAYSGCMKCFLPQAWCNQWEQSEQEGGMYRRKVGEKCGFADVVLSGVVVGLDRKEIVVEMQGRMAAAGFDMSEETEGLKYMGRRRRWGGLEASELLREFYLIRRGR